MKGNVLELAVAVIIAGAFGAIIKSLTADVIMPPLGLALGGVDFSSLTIIHQEGITNDAGELLQEEVAIRYGIFIQRILDFLIIGLIVFMIVRSYNRLTEKKKAEEAPPAPKGPTQEELLAEIRDLLKK